MPYKLQNTDKIQILFNPLGTRGDDQATSGTQNYS